MNIMQVELVLVVMMFVPPRPVGPSGAVEKMDRMKIIKRRLSMSLRSARPVDDSLSELAEQMALDEPSTARDNGETRTSALTHLHTGKYSHLMSHMHIVGTYFKHNNVCNIPV